MAYKAIPNQYRPSRPPSTYRKSIYMAASNRNSLPSNERLLELFSYDEETGKLFRSSGPRSGEEITQTNARGYLMVNVDNKRYRAHRVIWKMVYGYDPDTIDHDDRNKSNNRLSNLKDGTQQDNLRNRTISHKSRSGVLGVTFCKATQRWRSEISIGGKSLNLGRFSTVEEAAQARLKAASERNIPVSLG
jgi:hypothetical protein